MSDQASPPITRETTTHGGVCSAEIAGSSRKAELTWRDRQYGENVYSYCGFMY